MRKVYVINNKKYWYEEGTQPSNAIEYKKEIKKKEVTKEVQEKVVEPKNKVVKTTKRK